MIQFLCGQGGAANNSATSSPIVIVEDEDFTVDSCTAIVLVKSSTPTTITIPRGLPAGQTISVVNEGTSPVAVEGLGTGMGEVTIPPGSSTSTSVDVAGVTVTPSGSGVGMILVTNTGATPLAATANGSAVGTITPGSSRAFSVGASGVVLTPSGAGTGQAKITNTGSSPVDVSGSGSGFDFQPGSSGSTAVGSAGVEFVPSGSGMGQVTITNQGASPLDLGGSGSGTIAPGATSAVAVGASGATATPSGSGGGQIDFTNSGTALLSVSSAGGIVDVSPGSSFQAIAGSSGAATSSCCGSAGGAPGPAGPAGPAGPPGPSGLFNVEGFSDDSVNTLNVKTYQPLVTFNYAQGPGTRLMITVDVTATTLDPTGGDIDYQVTIDGVVVPNSMSGTSLNVGLDINASASKTFVVGAAPNTTHAIQVQWKIAPEASAFSVTTDPQFPTNVTVVELPPLSSAIAQPVVLRSLAVELATSASTSSAFFADVSPAFNFTYTMQPAGQTLNFFLETCVQGFSPPASGFPTAEFQILVDGVVVPHSKVQYDLQAEAGALAAGSVACTAGPFVGGSAHTIGVQWACANPGDLSISPGSAGFCNLIVEEISSSNP